MMIHEYKKNNKVLLEGVYDFNLDHIFRCGQGFRWTKEDDGSYTGVVKGKILNVLQENDKVYLNNTNLEDFNNIWYKYFGFDIDYSSIKYKLSQIDEHINNAVDFGCGLRILDQDEWEMLITFILSTNNSINMVKKVIEDLSLKFGDYIGEYNGNKYYSFPTPQQLSKVSIEELRACKTGFRDKYIKSAADMLVNNEVDIYKISNLDTESCISKLKEFSGVGMKVADCVAMFGMRKRDIFPVDIWVKRFLQEFYLDEYMSLPKIRKYSIEKFGGLSSFVQHYLFYYARENSIGK